MALQQRLDRGEAKLRFHGTTGYLEDLLSALGISQASQLLVFSKTSCQRERISPLNPRAVYFNDQSYVAFIPGSSLLELSCVEPGKGAVFYTLDQREAVRPQLVQRSLCLECHTSDKTLGISGYLVRSYETDANGIVDITDGYSMTDHRTPFAERWGGWQLTGAGARARVAFAAKRSASIPQPIELASYLHGESEVAALLVLEHQAQMQNLITRLHQDALTTSAIPAREEKRSLDALLRYMLFIDEAPLPAPIHPEPGFAAWFQSQGPRDDRGRSLRELDLQTRLFKYPCSYLVYSPSFDALPRRVKVRVYHRLASILSGRDADRGFGEIAAETGRAILEILAQTKPDVPVDWTL